MCESQSEPRDHCMNKSSVCIVVVFEWECTSMFLYPDIYPNRRETGLFGLQEFKSTSNYSAAVSFFFFVAANKSKSIAYFSLGDLICQCGKYSSLMQTQFFFSKHNKGSTTATQ